METNDNGNTKPIRQSITSSLHHHHDQGQQFQQRQQAQVPAQQRRPRKNKPQQRQVPFISIFSKRQHAPSSFVMLLVSFLVCSLYVVFYSMVLLSHVEMQGDGSDNAGNNDGGGHLSDIHHAIHNSKKIISSRSHESELRRSHSGLMSRMEEKNNLRHYVHSRAVKQDHHADRQEQSKQAKPVKSNLDPAGREEVDNGDNALWHYGSDLAMNYLNEPNTSLGRTLTGGGSAELHALASSFRPPLQQQQQQQQTQEEMIDMRVLSSTLAFDNEDGGVWKQGWDVQPVPLHASNNNANNDKNNTLLTIFVVPHAHCDPGWIKTFDKYFQTETRQILTTVYNALLVDKRRKFIWAEISYFEWWWREQSTEVRHNMKRLIRDGQFEFVTGGWVQPDEANTQRYAIEVQLQEGQDWLRSTFITSNNTQSDIVLTEDQVLPKYGWSIDPFGYSPTMADVLHSYGFKGMLIQRVHYAIKKELAQRKHLEFKWRQTWDATGSHDIFTHVMPFYSYDVPHTCGPDPSVCCQFDFARLRNQYGGCPWKKPALEINSANVAQRSDLLLDQYRKKAALYRSNVVLAPLGDDFRYRSTAEAENQYNNYQRMFDYMNRPGSGVRIQFGTLREYFEAVKGTFDPPILKGSFFTYADRDQDYWSGYFTSRPFDKALDRQLERALYAATSMGASRVELRKPRRALSLFQHHDGVTGTAKNPVVEDYAIYMRAGIEESRHWMANRIAGEVGLPRPLLTKEGFGKTGKAAFLGACFRASKPRELDTDYCLQDVIQGRNITVFAYNPLESEQRCGDEVVPGFAYAQVKLPCETPGLPQKPSNLTGYIVFGPDGRMIHPLKEEWMVWKVKQGGAYLFFPGILTSYSSNDIQIEQGGYIVTTPHWKRTIVLKTPPKDVNEPITTYPFVIDLLFETNLIEKNQEWFVRLTAPIQNNGVFHTDLNGFNFDTHYFRKDLPIQSQVFPMPTLASIQGKDSQNATMRFTVISEHAQGTASLQDGSIDVWLDRRLGQDDARGLFQGVMDNVPTKTKLRVLLENDGFDINSEFSTTDLCQRLWNELNHPLELFGMREWNVTSLVVHGHEAPKAATGHMTHKFSPRYLESNIPFVYMVHKNVEFFKRAMESLRGSDYPIERLPIFVFHDGKVPEMMSFINDLKLWGFRIEQYFNPLSCYDHPSSFPADATELNVDYEGDQYHNKRSHWSTCSKHHFAFTLRAMYNMIKSSTDTNKSAKDNVDGMVFLQEHDLVSPTIYTTVAKGLDIISHSSRKVTKENEYFGVALQTRNKPGQIDGWMHQYYPGGSVLLQPSMIARIIDAAEDYCAYDEYNWDLSVIHLQMSGKIPHRTLSPSFPQIVRIGTMDMHNQKEEIEHDSLMKTIPFKLFRGDVILDKDKKVIGPKNLMGNGGFGHPKDHEYCTQMLSGKVALVNGLNQTGEESKSAT